MVVAVHDSRPDHTYLVRYRPWEPDACWIRIRASTGSSGIPSTTWCRRDTTETASASRCNITIASSGGSRFSELGESLTVANNSTANISRVDVCGTAAIAIIPDRAVHVHTGLRTAPLVRIRRTVDCYTCAEAGAMTRGRLSGQGVTAVALSS